MPEALIDAGKGLGLFGGGEWEYASGGWSTVSDAELGWSDPSIAATEVAKWPDFLKAVSGAGMLGVSHEATSAAGDDLSTHNTVMSFGYVLGRARSEPLRVLDWGGGLGHYYVLARRLWPDLCLNWTCKDVPAMCAPAEKLLPEVRFVSDDSCLDEQYGLVMALSSLQYARDWRSILDRLAKAAQPWLYIGRLPVAMSSPSFTVIQDPRRYGYRSRYVGWFLNRAELLLEAESCDMALEREFLEGERPFVRRAPERGQYRGFLFRRADSRPGSTCV